MIELTDILPIDLKNIFESVDYDEAGGLKFHSSLYLNNELHFNFSLFVDDDEYSETQFWQLQVLGYRDAKIDINKLGNYFEFYSDHFLLCEFTDEQTELYFRKSANNPEKLLAEMYSVHHSIFDDYIPLEKFICGSNLLTKCQTDFGQFARGPKRILQYYYDCLESSGNEPYFFGTSLPNRWDGEKFIPEEANLKIALLCGNYFIGQDFKFIRLENP